MTGDLKWHKGEESLSEKDWEWAVDEEPIRFWAKSIGARFVGCKTIGHYEAAIFKLDGNSGVVERTMPGFSELSGSWVMFKTNDCDVLVFLEDWLEGCIPNDLRYPDWPSMSERREYGHKSIDRYCTRAMKRKLSDLSKLLGSGWVLAVSITYLVEDEGKAITRFAWVRR